MMKNNSEIRESVSIEDVLSALDELTETLVDKFGKKSSDRLNGDDVNDIESF